MNGIIEILERFITTDNIALLSVIITILIFVISRHEEIRYKKYDDKKTQYLKLIKLMEVTLMGVKKDNKGDIVLTDELKKQFFDTGSSLLLYGSKKLYRQYLLFREFSTNSLIKQCKYYKEDIIIYIMSEILVTMRKEVGLSCFNSIKGNEALAFFVNDISNNPIGKEKELDAIFRIKMIRFELMIIDRTKFIFVKSIYFKLIKPIISGVLIVMKYILVIPGGYIIIKLFPSFAQKVQNDK